MFGFPDGQIDILKGKVADLRLPYLAKQREKIERESAHLFDDEDIETADSKSVLHVIRERAEIKKVQ